MEIRFSTEIIRPTGFVFDVDGTITDTEGLMASSNLKLLCESSFGRDFLAKIGQPDFSNLPALPGQDMRGHIIHWIDEYADGDRLLKEAFEHFMQEWLHKLETFWGHLDPESINVFPDFKNFASIFTKDDLPYTYATNNQKVISKIILTKAGLGPGTGNRGLTTATECEHPKPHPEISSKAIEKLGNVDLAGILAIGDSLSDAVSALNAGIPRCVLIDRAQQEEPHFVPDFDGKVLKVKALTELVIAGG